MLDSHGILWLTFLTHVTQCYLKGSNSLAVHMAKYSTGGGGGGGDGDTCELCGAQSDTLQTASIAGATLQVCRSCQPHGDTDKKQQSTDAESQPEGGPSRKKEIAQRIAKAQDAVKPDTTRWEREGAGYDDDPLPYLTSEYGSKVTEARQSAGLKLEELADELDIREQDLLAVEQGRAARAGVGGSVIDSLEDYLDITIQEGA